MGDFLPLHRIIIELWNIISLIHLGTFFPKLPDEIIVDFHKMISITNYLFSPNLILWLWGSSYISSIVSFWAFKSDAMKAHDWVHEVSNVDEKSYFHWNTKDAKKFKYQQKNLSILDSS